MSFLANANYNYNNEFFVSGSAEETVRPGSALQTGGEIFFRAQLAGV